ncbi:MAG: tetratricopeptide repeat protein, partial [Planctomycetota bacterium]
MRMNARSVPIAFLVAISWFAMLAPLPAQQAGRGIDRAAEAEMAAYADAANFQTGGAIDLAIQSWRDFLKRFPKSERAAKASHYLGICYMQQETPNYKAAEKSFASALDDDSFELREESLANRGFCLFTLAGEAPNRDPRRLKQTRDTFTTLRKEFPTSRFLDRAYFYSGEASYGLGEFEQAVKLFNQLLSMPTAKDSPLRCDALYARGVAQEELDQRDAAMASFKQVLQACRDSDVAVDVQLRLGDLSIANDDYQSSLRYFDDAFKLASKEDAGDSVVQDDMAYALFRQGFALVQLNDPGKAAQKYEQLLSKFPRSTYAGPALLASAQSTYRSGNISLAATRFEKVLDQTNVAAATEAAHWLARIKIQQKDYAAAQSIARQRIDNGLQGDFATALRLDLAESLSFQPETLPDSLKVFRQAYQDAPDDPLASRALYNAAFTALQLGNTALAAELSATFIKRFPSDQLAPDVQFIRAESLFGQGDSDRAIRTYRTLLTRVESNVQRPYWVIRAATLMNSASQFDATIDLLPSELDRLDTAQRKAEAQLLLGQAHLRLGNAAKAAVAFRASQQADPSGVRADEAVLLAGQATLASGDSDAAIQIWQQLIQSSPDSRMADQARYKLGQLASNQGRFRDAIQVYDQVLASDKDPALIPFVQYAKGWALMQTRAYQNAVKPLADLLRQQSQHPLRD